MNRLFWKFFAAFWLGLVLFSGATFWLASSYLERTSAYPDRESVRAHYRASLRSAQSIARQQGEEALKRWLRKLDRKDATPYYLVDDFGDDLLDRPLPEHLALRLERENRRAELNPAPEPGEHRSPGRFRPFPHGIVELPDHGKLRLVADPKGVTLARILKRPRVIALPLLIAAISSALICLLLARYLVRPINRLQEASRQVARGDFELQVAASLNHRKDEIGDLARDFDLMAKQLQKLVDSQRQLLSDVSHELRSPLARLQAALGLLQKRLLDVSTPDWSEQARFESLQRIELEAEKMSELIGQILSLSRMEASHAKLQLETFDLVELLQAIVDDANFEASQPRVVLHSTAPQLIEAQSSLLSSAIENVIRNALKYSPPEAAIEVTLESQERRTDVVICDRGPGVPQDKLETIFAAFTRLDTARQTDQGGHGIGLALARKILQKHGGDITASNRPSGGLCVRLSLPRSIDTNA